MRYSPLVVDHHPAQSTVGVQNQSQTHQIITMTSGGIQQTSQASNQQPQGGLSVENVLASLSSASHTAVRKNETTPVKGGKKAPKVSLRDFFRRKFH